MSVLLFSSLLFLGSLLAGLLGAMTGLGGGVVLVPLLALAFGVDLHYAIGASLVSVIATSSGAAAAYVKEGFSNIRIGMFLEIATTLGAIVGAHLTTLLPASVVAVVFGVVLIGSAFLSVNPRMETSHAPPNASAARLRLDGHFPTAAGPQTYHAQNVPGGFLLMMVAGILSGLLGIGSGAVKVLAMDHVMRLPFKVSTTTSNFMIGVTAAASAGVYLSRGLIDPRLVMPVMLGVLLGALIGSRVLVRANNRLLRLVFAAVIVALGLEMIVQGYFGKL